MATCPQIREWIAMKYGWKLKDCWIADVKERCGIKVPPAPNRKGPQRANPYPDNKFPAIEDALRRFEMVKKP